MKYIYLAFFLLTTALYTKTQAQCGSHPDYESLIALYDSTNGAGWSNNTGWRDGKAGTNCDPCNGWVGVQCENGRVSSLELAVNNLIGTIGSIENLAFLKVLSLHRNSLNGSFPDVSKNTLLETINISFNNFSGKLPDFTKLTNLQNFYAVVNQFDGQISELNLNTKLIRFSVARNKLSGVIPNLSKNLSLQEFTCDNNQLSGSIPALDQNLNLLGFECSYNQLIGSIPNLDRNVNLTHFLCSNNQLKDSIPNLDKNVNLFNFYCNNNQLTGSIPNLSKNLRLQKFVVNNNRLSGPVPDLTSQQVDTMYLDTLSAFIFDNNDLSGCYNSSICKFRKNNVSFLNNPKLPFKGDHRLYCAGVPELGATCDDGDSTTTSDKIVDASCNCKGVISVCGTHPDYESLMALYDSTNGAEWKNNTGWRDGKAGTNCDPCNGWFGVDCENGRVTSVNLGANSLGGQLTSLDKLTLLEIFDVSYNKLIGSIPNIDKNTKLKSFNCSKNQLTGSIPNLDKNVNLISFGCSFNQLSGAIPSLDINFKLSSFECIVNKLAGLIPGLEKNVNLQYFNCRSNFLTGSIPNLDKNRNLQYFDCGGNFLTGLIPNLDKNTNLSNFDCRSNLLTGSIPILDKNVDLSNFSCSGNQLTGSITILDKNINLSNFDCSGNQLTGSIPNLDKNANLKGFYCSFNQLSGKIPNLEKNLNLTGFFCEENKLTGSIPNLDFNINLTTFWCMNNQLTGIIPNLDKNLNLLAFRSSHNKLTGSIPNLDKNLNLQYFYCEENQLTGSFPNLGNNLNLIEFNCNINRITGSIPILEKNINLQYFDCSSNQVTGSIPSLIKNPLLLNFSVNNNNLTGSIPDLSAQKDSISVGLYGRFNFSNNNLSGCYNTSICRFTKARVSFLNNPRLPFKGDHKQYCAGIPVIGASCDDGDSTTTSDKIVDASCNCKGSISVCGTHPDYESLIALYDSTNGAGWTNNTGWRDGKAGTNCDPCNGWEGVECDSNRVVSIRLEGNNLSGTLTTLNKVKNLKHFNVNSNKLVGIIPNIDSLVNLEYFDVGSNRLVGNIPNLSNNTQLTFLSLSSNVLNGSVPSLLNNRKLEILYLNDNRLTGQFPSLDNCVKIRNVACYFNQFTGPLPKLDKNIELEDFWGMVNQFSGPLPDLSKNIKLDRFDVNTNRITGIIPSLTNNTRLQNFNVSSNQLIGSVPDLSGQIDSVTNSGKTGGFIFDLNDLSGCYNPSICKFTKIKVSFLNNPKLPFKGDHTQYCAGVPELGATCDDGDSTTINDKIVDASCNCKGIISVCGTHPDYESLIALYDSTNGAGWSYNTGWRDGKAGTNCDPCNGWEGVDCENGRVTGIHLGFNNLTGQLTSLEKLTSLEIFEVFYNNLKGSIPNLDKNLNLLFFYCGKNQLTNSIPNLDKNLNLLYFVCDDNKLTGTIPNLDKNLNLRSFDCSFNQLKGSIPKLDKNLKLLGFQCSNNQLTGVIPNFDNNFDLSYFDCSNNQLTGSIPEFSAQKDVIRLTNSDSFNFNNNDLSGCYNSSICKFSKIKISFLNNPKLPFKGDHTQYCAGVSISGASCDDGDSTTINDKIRGASCMCVGTPVAICNSITLKDDFIELNAGQEININYKANDVLPTKAGLDTIIYRFTVNPVNTPSLNSIIINNANEVLNVRVLNPWSDTIVLRYSIFVRCGIDTVVRSANIYLVNIDALAKKICSSVMPFNDVVLARKGYKVFLNPTENDFINNISLIEPSNAFKFEVRNMRTEGKRDVVIEKSGSLYSITVNEDWVDTIYVLYDLCLTSPCDTCVTARIAVYNDALSDLVITTIFSPDGDGMNDVLRFNAEATLRDSELEIFNRYGDRVYSKKDYTNDWDAYGYAGGIYFYVLKYKGLVIKRTLTIVK